MIGEGPVHLLDSVQSIFVIIMDCEALQVEDEISYQYTRNSMEAVKQTAKQGIRSFILRDDIDADDDWEAVLSVVNALSLIYIRSSEV